MAKESTGKKFPLLIYRRWGKMLRLPSLLIVVACGVAWWFAPDIPLLAGRDWVAIVIGLASALIFVYSLTARRMAFVQCRPNYFKIRTPTTTLRISYRRILQARPVLFRSQLSSSDLKRTRRRLLEPFLGRTIVVLELKKFPGSERRLRRSLPWYMFASDVTGFVLVIEDWMALSQQIVSFSDRFTTRHLESERAEKRLW